MASQPEKQKSIYDLTVKDAKGNDVDLSTYKGKVLLIVNVASKCGLTNSNYIDLNHLYEKYKDQGMEILAFPCNQFGAQEPGTNDEIVEFACTNFKSEFPIFDKIEVNGENTSPVYKFLKSAKWGLLGDNIQWNFAKFLVDKNGQVSDQGYQSAAGNRVIAKVKPSTMWIDFKLVGIVLGKPLTVDMATRNQTRPSCARVKVEVNLVAKLSHRVKINEENDTTGEIKSKWTQIQYDYMPKYCKECCQQGYDEESWWNIHPKIYAMITTTTTTNPVYSHIVGSGEGVENQNTTCDQLMMLEQDKYEKQYMVLEGISPLAIGAGNLMKLTNKKKEDMDKEDLEDNIEIENLVRSGSDHAPMLLQFCRISEQDDTEDFSMLEVLPTIVSEAHNSELNKVPTMKKVKIAIMGLNRNNARGPDGTTGAFYQDAWNIIAKDLHQMIIAFFCGYELPGFITHTNMLVITTMEKYERFFGQKINEEKSALYLHKNVSNGAVVMTEMRKRDTHIWFDNWTGVGDMYSIMQDSKEWDDRYQYVQDLVLSGKWNEELLKNLFSKDMMAHILHKVRPPEWSSVKDKAIWIFDPREKFTIKSAWQYVRQRKMTNDFYKQLWIKGLPFKIVFFLWKMWKEKIPVDDTIRRWGVEGTSKC
ncbi:putative phospholipid hydroperoxide glutathione peroxidase [Capsicum annuum]|nr:putative phospholipid hydroperoxide glutathione peroxidase [Capsicum annuum]